jgi:hypothetical protein
VDWTHGKGTLTGYYFLDGYSLDNPYPTGTGGASVPGFDATSNGFAQLASLGHTMTFGQTALNEFHLSFMRNDNSVGQPKGGVGPLLVDQGFSGIFPLKQSTEGIANVAFNDFTLGVDTTAIVQAENIYEMSDAFSRILGKHGLKVGGEIHANQINTHPDVIFNGSFAFNGSETGVDFADFLLGVTSSYTQGRQAAFITAISTWRPLCRTVGSPLANSPSTTACAGIGFAPGARSSTSCKRWSRASNRRSIRVRRWG